MPGAEASRLEIRVLDAEAAQAAAPDLGEVLADCVAGGASVGFMLPFDRAAGEAFFAEVAAGVAAGRTRLLAAELDGRLVGTVQLHFAALPNQPHRGEIAKMLVHRSARRRGVAEALLAAAEAEAERAGRWLLVLDTVTGSDAERLYVRLGWQRCGPIPDYALWPDGRLCETTFFYKRLAGGSLSAAVRDARDEDLPAILAIHNDAILNSLAIWQYEPVDLENRREWLGDRRARGQPVLVAELAGAVAGYASYGDFRHGAGYGGTVEDSVYVRADLRGRGLARVLMQALIDRAEASGLHVLVAGIGLPNDASVALHASLGFIECGRLREIGRKHGAWLDLLLMQRILA